MVGKKRGKKRRKTFKIPLFKREKWRVSGEFENRKPHIYFNVEGSTVLKVIGSNYAVDFRGENSDRHLVNLFYLSNSCIQLVEMFSASFQLIIAVSAAFFFINVSCDQKSFLTKPAANDHVGNEIINVRGASTTVYDGETATLHNSRKVSVVQSSWALAASIQYYITTIAGIGLNRGYSGDGLDATTAQLSSPYGIAVDALGNIYVADSSNHCIRKVGIVEPTASPTAAPSVEPTASPTAAPSVEPTASPSAGPSVEPTASPSAAPSARPAACLSVVPSKKPAASPSLSPTCKKHSPPVKRPRRPTRT